MAKKSKQQIQNESKAKEVAANVAAEVQKLIENNYAFIAQQVTENGWLGTQVAVRFTVKPDGLLGTFNLSVPRKALRVRVEPESPSDKIQEKFSYNDDAE